MDTQKQWEGGGKLLCKRVPANDVDGMLARKSQLAVTSVIK